MIGATALRAMMIWATTLAPGDSFPIDAGVSADLMRADIIVHGTVESVENQMVPASEYDPEWSMGGYFSIAYVNLHIEDVLLGTVGDGETMTFLVNQGQSDIEGRYSAGDDVVMALMYDPSFRGGAFELRSGHGHLIRCELGWMTQTGKVLSGEELRSLAYRASLEGVASASTCIIVGDVISTKKQELRNPNDARRYGRVWLVELAPERWIKGQNPSSGNVVFMSFIGGSYRPDWAGAGPREVSTGQKYCAFLHNVDGELVVTGGVSGLLRVQPDGTLVRNDIALKKDTADLARIAREQ